jgi:2-polyprenyl-3-methyl-5-hydroxy-6-metoxy-1,4-benzoquinol methylase
VEEFEAGVAYDVVHCSHVLEHVSSPATLMTRLYDWTKAGGVCVIEAPNQLMNVFAVRNRLLHRYPKRTSQVADVLHLSFFDLHTLIDLCNRAGFRIVTKGSWYLPGAGARTWRPDYWLTRGIGKFLCGGPNVYVVATKPGTTEAPPS